MAKKTSLFIYCVLVLMACEKPVDIKVPKKEPKLVINGLLEKDQLIAIGITKSQGVLDPVGQGSAQEHFTVKTATPVVYENNTAIDTLVYQPADYSYKSVHNKTIRDGNTYAIKVTAPGFNTAEVSSSLPSQSVIAELRRVRNVRTNSSGSKLDEITIKLNDPVAEKNFYLVQVWSAYGFTIYCVSTNDKDVEPVGDETDPTVQDNCFDGGSLLMKDVNFNGNIKVLKLTVESSALTETTSWPGGRVHRPYVKVFRITEDQFKYVKSYNIFKDADENPFAEPVNVFSNVKNGYGIFSLSTVAVDTLR